MLMHRLTQNTHFYSMGGRRKKVVSGRTPSRPSSAGARSSLGGTAARASAAPWPPPRRRIARAAWADRAAAAEPPPCAAVEPDRRPTACREQLRKRAGRGVERPRGEGGVRRRVRAAGGAGSVQGVCGVVARAQGRVRGAGVHLRASHAASSNRRGPRGRRGRRAKKYGRRLKPAPGLCAAPSSALELSKHLHRSRYL